MLGDMKKKDFQNRMSREKAKEDLKGLFTGVLGFLLQVFLAHLHKDCKAEDPIQRWGMGTVLGNPKLARVQLLKR